MTVPRGVIFVLLCLLQYHISVVGSYDLEESISKIMKSTFTQAAMSPEWKYLTPMSKSSSVNRTDESSVEGLCSNILTASDRTRLACCPKTNGGLLYLNNVQILGGKLIFFTGDNDSDTFTTNLDGTTAMLSALPPITSVIRRQNRDFYMPVEYRRSKFANAKCKSYFNGTLHVMGRLTTQNLYHTLNDNVLPLLTLIILDAFLRPDLLYAPRAQLLGFHPPSDREQVPHLQALLHAAIPRSFEVGGSAEGVCFRRVAWGGGIKVIYQHLMGAVRRLSTDLLRELVLGAFDPPNPYGSINSHAVTPSNIVNTRYLAEVKPRKRIVSKVSSKLVNESLDAAPLTMLTPTGEKRPLNIVVYSRGSSGTGRSIANETILVDRLRALGARAVVCCDFRNTSLTQQLGYGAHADVIMGLHGAGLINNVYAPPETITMELKTVYGYDLTLFAVAAEARRGPFIQLNLKDYHIWGKPGQSRHRPIDESLINRVVASLRRVVSAREQRAASGHDRTPREELSRLNGGDFRHALVEHLRIPDARSGDLAIYPYPTEPYLLAVIRSSDSAPPAFSSAQAKQDRQLDFLLHALGPVVTEASAQCARMPVASYWEHTGEKNVLDKYCLVCPLSPEGSAARVDALTLSPSQNIASSIAVPMQRKSGASQLKQKKHNIPKLS